MRFLKSIQGQLFLTSFTLLYLELTLIRFIPAYVLYLGYFTNFILLGSFLGIGIGCLLAKQKRQFLLLTPLLLTFLMLVIKYFRFEIQVQSGQTIFFTSNTADSLVNSYILLPGLFLLVTLIFAALAQKLGRLLTQLPPLTAYSVDIVGSICGISAFAIGSALATPAPVWFIIFATTYLLMNHWEIKRILFTLLLLAATIYISTTLDTLPTQWSPYYKITPYEIVDAKNPETHNHYRLYVNNVSHQEMTTYTQAAAFYTLFYKAVPDKTFAKALIVGAGSGEDVMVGLRNRVQEIHAVEIDPAIAKLGRQLHPEKPYDDPRVTVIVNDARSYLENTTQKYDLVIFALPDSLVLTSSQANLRLESYLFTLESFARVKEHLTPNGVFVLYNYYRTPWLIDKIDSMLTTTFNTSPWVARYEDYLAVFMAGPGIETASIAPPFQKQLNRTFLAPATDDWPFLYLNTATIPRIYIKSLGIIFLIAIGLSLLVTRGKIVKNFAGDFFFLGAAFLLIETKTIVNFNLLFGSTWLVNALVFIAILLSVLLAIWVNRVFTIKQLTPWLILLMVALMANYLIPIQTFLLPQFWIRYGVASVFFFSPIFLANVIFSNLFKRVPGASDNFGANLLGSFFGGMGEYLSLLVGYRSLVLVAIIFYALAFWFVMRRFRRR